MIDNEYDRLKAENEEDEYWHKRAEQAEALLREVVEAVIAQDAHTWWLGAEANRARVRYIKNGPDRKLARVLAAVGAVLAAARPEEPCYCAQGDRDDGTRVRHFHRGGRVAAAQPEDLGPFDSKEQRERYIGRMITAQPEEEGR